MEERDHWFLSVLVKRLRERGRFDKLPARGEMCFYANPLRNLAKVGSPPVFSGTDLVRELQGLRTSDPTLWQVLSIPYEGVSSEYAINRLSVVSGGWPYKWACLFEWLAKYALVHPDDRDRHWSSARLHFNPRPNSARIFRKHVLQAYVELFERLAEHLDLPTDLLALRCSYEDTTWTARPLNVSTATTIKWKSAPPFAGMLLTMYLQAKGTEFDRGHKLSVAYWSAIQSGQMISTPGGLNDFPDYREYCAPKRLEFAMAVDNYLFEYFKQAQYVLEDQQMEQIMEDSKPSLLDMPMPEDAATVLQLAWLNKVGQKRRGQGDSSRFTSADYANIVANESSVQSSTSPAIDATKLSVKLNADEEPEIEVFFNLPLEAKGDLHELRAVVYAEALVDGQAVADASFAFVDTIEVVENKGRHELKLVVLPVYARASLLYQLNHCRSPAVASARLMPVPWNVPGQQILGIHVVLGPLDAASRR